MSGVTNPVYRFSGLSESDSTNGGPMGGKGNGRDSGCHVSTATGFVLVLLAVLIAVGVGLIVHFAEKSSNDRELTCTFPQNVLAELLKQTQDQGSTKAPTIMPTAKPPATQPATPTLSPLLTPSHPPSGTATTPAPVQRSHRLPRDLTPLFYDLEIQPDIYGSDHSTFAFNGSVVIHFQCVAQTSAIVLNAKNLSIGGNPLVQDSTGRIIEAAEMYVLDDAAETLTIKLKDELRVNQQYTVTIHFSGPLTDDLTGLYLSSYKRGDQTVYLATTQFESPDAREAFPCFDEPAMKAHFNVTIVRKDPLVSLSNTQIVDTRNRSNGWKADVYETTPKMSTYLLAIIVCDFESIRGTTNKSVLFEVWSRKELVNQTRFALDVGMKVLDYYGDFFGIDFPLKKQAMVAIPDFGNGAMENWGLVTYRENYLTIQEGVTSESTKNMVALYIAHELAHQWFGNLVTLAWWDDLWLNEGFAEFVEYIGLDYINKDWKVWEQFVVDSVQRSLTLDQLVSSHPLYSPVQSVEDADQYFDTISYEKGSSVIRMLQFVMGTDTFHRGLQKYLRAHAYGNANHTDLWNSLAEQAQSENKRLYIDDIMNTWTEQMGFPVVKVTRNGPTDVRVTQKRFLINPEAKDPGTFHSTFGYKWWVPITLATSMDLKFNVTDRDVEWLTKDMESRTISMTQPLPDVNDPNGWVLANVQQYGYYRVNYDDANWNALIKQLQKDHTVIPPINRAQIIDDAWNLASAGETNISIALGTLEYLGAEMDYIPWKVASIQIGSLKTLMADSSHYGALNRFIQDRIRGVFNQLGLDDTNAPALESYTRAIVASIACGAGLPECVNQVVQLFKKWRDDPDNNPIAPNVRSQVYCTGVARGDESDWLFMLTRYRQETSPNEKRLFRRALTCTSRSYIMNTLLKMSLERGDIKRDDATGMIGYVAGSSAGSRMAWDFVREHWDTIMSDFSQSASMLKFMIDSIASRFHDEFHLNELKAFMNSLGDMGSSAQTLNQALETVEFNIKWYKNSYPQIRQWLEQKGYHEFEGSESKTSSVTKEDVLLPDDLRPSHYDLVIEPNMYGSDPDKFTFNGTLAMNFTCVKATNQIVMHAHELDVNNIVLSPDPHLFVSMKLDTDKQFLIIKLSGRLSPGQNYSVSMNFQGKLEDDRDGLYLSSYKNGTTTVYLATTQFESVAARKAFPCMDEPALKATFSTTIIRRTWNVALSNMPVETSTNLGDGRVADKFQTSLPMSSYLVALIVCDFKHKTSYTTTGNITYEVWGRPSAYDQLDFALEFGVKAIDYFQNYFNVSFPLPKQSMIGIPDFSAGAMENWGLITYRETRILVQEGVSSRGDKEATSMTIAHELAHMWFGDLVSPMWWDDIWLNEGFARFMQYLAVDFVNEGWKEWDQFVTVVVHKGMKLDGYVSSHPVFVPVATPEQINEVFDSISYDKGASIIRMIRHAIGYDTFKKGITNYLNRLKYGNANHTDLWNALNEQARRDGQNVDVGDVMDTWTLQMNYPMVTVKRRAQLLRLTQSRFLSDPTAKDTGRYQSPFGYKWDVPFTYTTSVQPDFDETRASVIWMMKNETEKTVLLQPNIPASAWVLANVKEVGYYRVNYEDDNWLLLANQLRTNHSVIDPVNRAQIINDAWNLARGGYLNQTIALRVVEYLDKERDYVPWNAAAKELNYVSAMLVTTGLYGAFKDFLANKTTNQYTELGMNNTNAALLESFLRSQIVGLACSSGVANCVSASKTLFSTWRNDPGNNPISPEVRSAVYCTALRYGTVEDWDFLYDRYVKEQNVNEKNRLMFQLPCSKEIWVLSRLLDRVLSSDDIRGQDKMYIVQNVLSNSAGRTLAWRYLRENWDTIFKMYGQESFTLSNVASTIGETFNTRIELEELENFVSTHPNLGTAARAFQIAIESVRSNVRWMDERYGTIKDWLQGLGYYKP